MKNETNVPALEMSQVSFSYSGNGCGGNIRNISLTLNSGEFLLLTGRSGCGKTTLTRLINGLVPHFYPGWLTGQTKAAGLDIDRAPTYEIAAKVGSVFQDPRSQFFSTNTTAEVAFGCENLGLERSVIKERVAAAFRILGIQELHDRSIFKLSSGEKQKIVLASTYAVQPSIYVLDEPSANLDIASTSQLKRLLALLKASGNTVIIAEHKLYYLMELADRILYLENGQIRYEWNPRTAMSLSDVQRQQLGLRAFSLNQISAAKPACASSNVLPIQPFSLHVKALSVKLGRREIISQLNFTAHSGDIIGITGKNGAGKTTLVRLLCGLLKETSGETHLNEQPLKAKERAKVSYFVMQDADYQLFTESVEGELQLGNPHNSKVAEKINHILNDLDLTPVRSVHPQTLSGGQKQRVTIASAAVSNASILYLDEPTSGLDGANMEYISSLLQQLAKHNKLIFVISHDFEFLLHTCNRIFHIRQGTLEHDFALEAHTVKQFESLLFEDDESKPIKGQTVNEVNLSTHLDGNKQKL